MPPILWWKHFHWGRWTVDKMWNTVFWCSSTGKQRMRREVYIHQRSHKRSLPQACQTRQNKETPERSDHLLVPSSIMKTQPNKSEVNSEMRKKRYLKRMNWQLLLHDLPDGSIVPLAVLTVMTEGFLMSNQLLSLRLSLRVKGQSFSFIEQKKGKKGNSQLSKQSLVIGGFLSLWRHHLRQFD